MRKAVSDVMDFHIACDIPILSSPAFPEQERVDLRMSLIREEFYELMDSIEENNLIETADAMADLIYVVVGSALEFGIPLERVWDEVQRSNMSKVDPTTGKVNRRADGKVLKPEGWTPPDIAKAIG